MVGKTKRRERAYRKAQAMKRKTREEEGTMQFEVDGYTFDARQEKGGWLVIVRTKDNQGEKDKARAVSREEFDELTEHAIHAILNDTPVMSTLPLFSFFVRQDHVPRWGVDVEDMARLEQFTDTVIALLPDVERIKEFLGENFIS